jgi:hypothetical protein
LPEITPNSGPTTITSNSAYIEGYITGNGAAYTHFTEYSSSSSLANYIETTRYTQSNITSSPQHESWNLVGLEPETTYFYRHVAYNNGGTTVSEIHSFTTAAAN